MSLMEIEMTNKCVIDELTVKGDACNGTWLKDAGGLTGGGGGGGGGGRGARRGDDMDDSRRALFRFSARRAENRRPSSI